MKSILLAALLASAPFSSQYTETEAGFTQQECESITTVLRGEWFYPVTLEQLNGICSCVFEFQTTRKDLSLPTMMSFCIGKAAPDAYFAYFPLKGKPVLGTEDLQVKGKIVEGHIGYLRIPSFDLEAGVVTRAVDELAKSNVRSLLLDLRKNRGGWVRVAKEFLNLFKPEEKDSVMFEIRKRYGKIEPYTSLPGSYRGWNIAVLVDEKSASSSEIVTGVLQLWGARVFGKKTYGKGTVQEIHDFDNGTAMKFTTGRYFFTNGATADGEGLMPDQVITENEEIYNQAFQYLRLVSNLH